MKVLFCGDVVGRTGREAVLASLPGIREKLRLDFVIVNGENAAGGFGITEKICRQFYDAGADVITTGNHAWDQDEIVSYIETDTRLLRPHNSPAATPGRGAGVFAAARGGKVLVIHVVTRLFMDPVDDPFACVEGVLKNYRLGATLDAIVLDVHGEATSEKMAMGHAFDGRVSLVVGTHCHVPTADAQVLPGGTAYLTDVGMCGDYDSVIGMQKKEAVSRFVTGRRKERLQPARGEATLCAVFAETDEETGLAIRIAPMRIGGRLASCWPD